LPFLCLHYRRRHACLRSAPAESQARRVPICGHVRHRGAL